VSQVVVGAALDLPGPHRQDRHGPVDRLDLDFASTLSTIAFSGGGRYGPTTPTTLASSLGSVEDRSDLVRHGVHTAVPPRLGHRGVADLQVPGQQPGLTSASTRTVEVPVWAPWKTLNTQ